jgi:hypothetical protein
MTNITDVVFVFTFSIGFGFEHKYTRIKYECGFFWLRVRIDVYRIRSGPDVDNVEHGYFFGYRVKAIFIHITCVVTFEHPMSPKFN